MHREMTEENKRLFDVVMRYIERFGNEELLPLMQMAPEAEEPEFQIELYERCLAEGKPAREYVKIYNEPGNLY